MTTLESTANQSSLLTKRNNTVLYENHPDEPDRKRRCLSSNNQVDEDNNRKRVAARALQSPTKQSMFHIYTKVPTQKAAIVKKLSSTNIKEGTETILYTIAITKPLPTSSSQVKRLRSPKLNNCTPKPVTSTVYSSNEMNKQAINLALLTDAAESALAKVPQTPPKPAFQSIDKVSTTNSHFRVKTLSTKENKTNQSCTSINRFSFVFK